MTQTSLRDLLRHWRKLRGCSQLELALRAEISQRHISFIENGRSVPSRDVLLGLARALDVPLRERNALLTAAGYAPAYSEVAWDSANMKAVTTAVRRMLSQQEPYPALVMDRYWNVLMTNEAAPRFFGKFVDLSAFPRPRNILRLMFDPVGLRPRILNWKEASRSLIERVRRECIGSIIDGGTRSLLDELTSLLPAPVETVDNTVEPLPFVALSFEWQGRSMNYFSLVTTVGAPMTVSAQELRLESLFPADEATERDHQALIAED